MCLRIRVEIDPCEGRGGCSFVRGKVVCWGWLGSCCCLCGARRPKLKLFSATDCLGGACQCRKYEAR